MVFIFCNYKSVSYKDPFGTKLQFYVSSDSLHYIGDSVAYSIQPQHRNSKYLLKLVMNVYYIITYKYLFIYP